MSPTGNPLIVEVLLTPPTASPIPSSQQLSLLHSTIANILQTNTRATTTTLPLPHSLAVLPIPAATAALKVAQIRTTVDDDDSSKTIPSWSTKVMHYHYTFSATVHTPPPGASAEALPSPNHDGLWEGLHFRGPLKSTLLSYLLARYAYGALPSSGFILLHGPPGTGKSSLATAVSQKMCVRKGHGVLVRLTHESLSKFFGESAHRVGGVFAWAVRQTCVVVVVVDEIESFGMVRDGGQMGDNVRVTNALITGLDLVRGCCHVFVIGTSNNVGIVDDAVVDRADLKLCVGAECVKREDVLKDCLERLVDKGLVDRVGEVGDVVELFDGVSPRRVEGCVVVAVGLCCKGGGVGGDECVGWETFEKALRQAASITTTV